MGERGLLLDFIPKITLQIDVRLVGGGLGA